MMSFAKQLIRKRQAIRLHIESMRVTQENLKLRRKGLYHQDILDYMTTDEAINRLGKKIAKAEQELAFLEEHWSCEQADA